MQTKGSVSLLGPDVSSAQLGRICRRYGVERLYVFGSRARGKATPSSDVDLFVEYKPRRDGENRRTYKLRPALERLVRRHVDLLTPGAFENVVFEREIKKDRVLVYEARTARTAS